MIVSCVLPRCPATIRASWSGRTRQLMREALRAAAHLRPEDRVADRDVHSIGVRWRTEPRASAAVSTRSTAMRAGQLGGCAREAARRPTRTTGARPAPTAGPAARPGTGGDARAPGPPARATAARGSASRRAAAACARAAAGGAARCRRGAASARSRAGVRAASRPRPRDRSAPPARRQAAPRRLRADRQVGVLAGGEGQRLVEAADALEQRPRVGDVARLGERRRRRHLLAARVRRVVLDRQLVGSTRVVPWTIAPGFRSTAASAAASQSGGGRQSSSVNSTVSARAMRQAALRLAAGPGPGANVRWRRAPAAASGCSRSSSSVCGPSESCATTTSQSRGRASAPPAR